MDSSSSSPIWKHYVFPSFHGADVRKSLLSHVLNSFHRKGIYLFIDNTFQRGMSLSQSLIEGIRGSDMAIVMLSRNYASSSWSLDELVEIMKCKEELGKKVLTVFYEVHPDDVRTQSGGFGKSFKKTCEGKTKKRIGGWIKALAYVANIPGERSASWTNEEDMVKKITIDVAQMIVSSSIDSDDVVGMRAHMEMMQKLLRLDLYEVRMIGIWGPSGIGKTTIAKDLYNQISHRFQVATFMVDIKTSYPIPCLDDDDAQLQLRNQLISKIGVEKEELKDKKVLLILDDADLLQLNALMKEIQGFGNGSRIIVITENLNLLDEYRINHVYRVNFPSWDEAFQIFCIHAFVQKHPHDGFIEISWEFVKLAGCIPSKLKTLGSVVRGKSKLEWKNILPRLKRNENVEADARRERTITNAPMDVKVEPPQVQVFINYRGDVRNSFVGYLADALRRSKINVFIDYREQRGEDLNILFKRIEDSGIAIAVFSSTYTESKWCLNELAKINERVQTGMLKVLPIFFKVTTSDVKKLNGDFGAHFRDQKQMYASDKPLIKRWKEAISDVSHKFGRTLDEKSNMLEIDFIEIIVKDVLQMLQAMSDEERGQLQMLQAISQEERGQSGLRVDDNEMIDYVRRKQHIAREKLLELNKSVVVRVNKLFAFPMVLFSVLVCFSIFLYFCFVKK